MILPNSVSKLKMVAWEKKLRMDSVKRSIFHMPFSEIQKDSWLWFPVHLKERAFQLEDEYFSMSGPKRGAVDRLAKEAFRGFYDGTYETVLNVLESLIGRAKYK